MTTLRIIYDQAFPGGHPPADGFMAYAGGAAEHTWADDEISAAAWTTPLCLPVWEYARGRSGADDGQEFTAWLRRHNVPLQALVLLSMEAQVDAPYVHDFAAKLPTERELALCGSIDSLFGNPEIDGWFPANPTGVPHLFAHAGVKGTQYAWDSLGQTGGYPVDLSMIAAGVTLWDVHPPQPSRSETTTGYSSLRGLAEDLGTSPSAILRITARMSAPRGYEPDVAAYINGCDLTAKMRAGLKIWVPA